MDQSKQKAELQKRLATFLNSEKRMKSRVLIVDAQHACRFRHSLSFANLFPSVPRVSDFPAGGMVS